MTRSGRTFLCPTKPHHIATQLSGRHHCYPHQISPLLAIQSQCHAALTSKLTSIQSLTPAPAPATRSIDSQNGHTSRPTTVNLPRSHRPPFYVRVRVLRLVCGRLQPVPGLPCPRHYDHLDFYRHLLHPLEVIPSIDQSRYVRFRRLDLQFHLR